MSKDNNKSDTVPLDSDREWAEFAASLLHYRLEPEFDLDEDQAERAKRKARTEETEDWGNF